MKKTSKLKVVISVLLICIISSLMPESISAATKKITIGAYTQLLLDSLNIDTTNTSYIKKAVEKGILKKENEFSDYGKKLTRSQCALLTERADEILHGKKYDKDMYERIVLYDRISDLERIPDKYQEAVIKIYSKGIIIGYNNGKYTQSRKFKGNKNISVSGAKNIVKRLANRKARRKMSPDGQLIRTTNLPKNYKDYEYILAAFPNSFYEMKFSYKYGIKQEWDKKKDGWVNVKKEEMKDYARPSKVKNWSANKKKAIDLYLYDWAGMVEQNLNHRFNVDYRTIGKEWLNGIRETYPVVGNEEMDNERTDRIKQYMKGVKQNKIVIEARQITVEPSTYYIGDFAYFRCYVKFKIKSCKNVNVDKNEIIYCNVTNIEKLKKGVWIERYFDIDIAQSFGSDDYFYAAKYNKIAVDLLTEREDGIIKN